MNLMPAGNDTVIIGIGEYQVGSMPMASIGLGSCVGLVIHDRQTGNGALVHIMLPSSHGKTDRPGKYADSAIDVLMTELTKKGSNPANLIAKIAGGSAMFKTFSGNLNIGERNVEVIRKLLKEKNIPIKGEDVGGCVGRTIFYYPKENGKLVIKKGDGTLSELQGFVEKHMNIPFIDVSTKRAMSRGLIDEDEKAGPSRRLPEVFHTSLVLFS